MWLSAAALARAKNVIEAAFCKENDRTQFRNLSGLFESTAVFTPLARMALMTSAMPS